MKTTTTVNYYTLNKKGEVKKEETKETAMTTGNSLKARIKLDYKTIVKKFGEPTFKYGKSPSEYSNFRNKVDVEWVIVIPETKEVVTIYNYKDGKGYLGKDGKDIKDITDWHIGAGFKNIKNAEKAVEQVYNYLNK